MMTVRLLASNAMITVNDGYGLRLIEQGHAVPAPAEKPRPRRRKEREDVAGGEDQG